MLLSTVEEASGPHSNYGRSVVNERVFNTVLTRARALFVAFGNPFYLLDAEKHNDSGRRCWKEFLKRCIECNSIVMPESTTEEEKHVLFTKVFEEEEIPPSSDSILESYEKEFRQRLDFSRGHWRLIERAADEVHRPTSAPSAAHSCHILECKTAREAEAVPLSTTGGGESFTITGIKSRGQALHGAVVEVEPLSGDSPSPTKHRHGKVVHVVEQSPQQLFLCRMDPFNSNLFIPLDGKGPKLVNLPPISRRLLQDSKAVEETLGKDKKNPVACFDVRGFKKGIPRLKDVIPFEAAKNLIFLVKFIEWQPDRVYPLAAVIDIFPAAHTAFHTERMLKAAYSEMMNPPPSVPPLRVPPLYLRADTQAITVDTVGTKYYDDAISIVCKKVTSESMIFTVGVHIVNVASQLSRDVAQQVVERGSAVFLDSATVMSPLVPQNVSNSLTLKATSIRPCITVSADIVVTEQASTASERSRIQVRGDITFVKTVIKKSNVQVLSNFTFDEAQATLNRALAFPCLTRREDGADQLCNLYFVAKLMREKRIGQPVLLLPCHEKESPSTVDVQAMVEELMLWANTEAAKYLSHMSPVALLRCQPEPSKEGWRELEGQRNALCSSKESGPRCIPLTVVKRAIQCLKSNPRDGKYLLSTESHYPRVLALNEKVLSFQNRASYQVKECKEPRRPEDLPKHHSVGSLYTHFTSPLWRGFDILVQHALLANLDQTNFPFEPKDLCDLARRCDQRRQISHEVAKEFQQMDRAVACFHNHYAVDTVVVSFQEKSMRLKAPSGQFSTDGLSLSISALNPSNLEQGSRRLTWKFKIFSADTEKPITLKGLDASCSGGVKIRKVCIPQSSEEGNPVKDMEATVTPDCLAFRPQEWATVERFLKAPNMENSEEAQRLLSRMSSTQLCASSRGDELHSLVFAQVEVTKQVSEGSMLRVWVGSSHQGPLLTTEVHIVQPVPFLSICHKHNANPSECFSSPILHNASLDHYPFLEEYITCWEEVLLAEAAQGSPSESELIVLQNVILNWPTMKKVNSAIEETHFIPEGDINLIIKEEVWKRCGSELHIDTGDFICAQYEIPERVHSVLSQQTDLELFAAPEAVRGVFHFVVAATKTVAGESKDVYISLKSVGKQNAPVSLRMQQVVRKADIPCTLQVIPCTVSYRQVGNLLWFNHFFLIGNAEANCYC